MDNEQKITLSSVRYFCVLMSVLMLLIYGALILSSNNYQNIYDSTIVKTGNQQLELVNFECLVPVGALKITSPNDCKVHQHRSELSSVGKKISDLETSKRKTLKSCLVLSTFAFFFYLIEFSKKICVSTKRKYGLKVKNRRKIK
ncbi:hypothetical protein [Photobacterium damselae]